jgi:virulence-associated protein VapD
MPMNPHDNYGESPDSDAESDTDCPPLTWSNGRMFAIAFDMDTASLRRCYPGDPKNAYDDIRRALGRYGFTRCQGSLYFGNSHSTAVTATLAAQALSKRYPWFRHAVRDMRLLRVEENNDLLPALGDLLLPFSEDIEA